MNTDKEVIYVVGCDENYHNRIYEGIVGIYEDKESAIVAKEKSESVDRSPYVFQMQLE